MNVLALILFGISIIATFSVGGLFTTTRDGYQRWIVSLTIGATTVACIAFFVGGRLVHLF